MPKIRLDRLLVERELVDSRDKGQRLILAALVEVDGTIITKAGKAVAHSARLKLLSPPDQFVSRGGIKLHAALQHTAINVYNTIALDIGASTGGFTDCLLQLGARKVFAIDVGYGQLHWKLRNDHRVINLERINARYISPQLLPELPDIVVIDVSFISLEKILPPLIKILRDRTPVLALVKPQFEAGKKDVPRGGIVRNPQVHIKVLQRLLNFCTSHQFAVNDLFPSTIPGASGNREYFLALLFLASAQPTVTPKVNIQQCVKQNLNP